MLNAEVQNMFVYTNDINFSERKFTFYLIFSEFYNSGLMLVPELQSLTLVAGGPTVLVGLAIFLYFEKVCF